MRFIQETDYSMQIKQEIVKMLTSNDSDWYISIKLIRAESTAISQLKHWLSKRYDVDLILSQTGSDRDDYIITILIDMVLYHLCSQSGMKDIPEHRKERYQDVLDWLKELAAGTIIADLPLLPDENSEYSDIYQFHSRPLNNNKW